MAKVPIRPSVAALPAYRAGARAQGRLVYKLSSNESPYPPLPGVMAAVADSMVDLNRYPPMAPDDLVAALACFHDLEPGQVAVGAGSVAILGHALTVVATDSDRVVYPWRSFEAYPIMAGITGAESVPVPLGPGGRTDLDALAAAAAVPGTRAVLICSPNNPTGPAVHQDEFDQFMAATPDDVLVILDEAYVEFVTDRDAVAGIAALANYPNLVVARTFSKAYGLAGSRVGYLLGRSSVIEAVRAVTTPFSVPVMAELAAVMSLGLQAEMRERVEEVIQRRSFMFHALRAEGWDPPEPQGNFLWLDLGADSLSFADACKRAGVLVRPFPDQGVRVSVGEQEGVERFLEVAATWV
ncbi:MAG: histidinol-phosphate transaminase [Bifidobacteriaceae bacterium]|jgi:histidinol-phosphate aminotransferase|nr:histidinol-phosphate transaminase [Bifidobacteriaceae bacterium]